MTSFPDTRHPEDLKTAIKKAGLQGWSPRKIQKALADGELPGYSGPYDIPWETCKYYVRRAKRAEQATGLTERAKQPIPDAVEAMAREILSELDQELKVQRSKATRDLDKLQKVAGILKLCAPLAKPVPGSKGKQAEPSKPADPLATALRKAKS